MLLHAGGDAGGTQLVEEGQEHAGMMPARYAAVELLSKVRFGRGDQWLARATAAAVGT
jgi:hypothetical protein